MALDTRIPLTVEPARIPALDLVGSQMRAQQFQDNQQSIANNQQQNQLNELRLSEQRLEMDDQKKAREENDALNRTFREAEGNPIKWREIARSTPQISAAKLLMIDEAAQAQEKRVKAMDDEKLAKDVENTQLFGAAIGAIRSEKDPVKRRSMLAAELARFQAEKRLSPEKAAQYAALDVDNDGVLESAEVSMRGYAAMLEDDKKRRAADAAKVEEEGKARTAREGARAEAANTFAGVADQESYTAWRNSLPQNIRGEYPNKFDPETTPTLVSRKARTQKDQDALDNPKRDTSVSELEAIAAGLRADPKNKGKSSDEILGLAAAELRKRENQSKLVGKKDEDAKEKDGQVKSLDQRIRELQRLKDTQSAEAKAQGEAAVNAQKEIDALLGAGTTEANRNERMRTVSDENRTKIDALAKKRDAASAASKAAQAKFTDHDQQQAAVRAEKDSLGGGGGGAPASDTVEVEIEGQRGTIPKSKLAEAQKRAKDQGKTLKVLTR